MLIFAAESNSFKLDALHRRTYRDFMAGVSRAWTVLLATGIACASDPPTVRSVRRGPSIDDTVDVENRDTSWVDPPQVHERRLAKCAAGSGYECDTLGADAEFGRGGRPDDELAASFYRRACERRFALGCSHLGVLMEAGRGIAKDVIEASNLQERACRNGSMPACGRLGVHFLLGGGGRAVDLPRARSTFEWACGVDHVSGCARFGDMLRDGLGGPVDVAKSLEVYVLACAANDPSGCVGLGRALDEGIGAPKHPALAAKYYEKACNRGDALGCAKLSHDAGTTSIVSSDE